MSVTVYSTPSTAVIIASATVTSTFTAVGACFASTKATTTVSTTFCLLQMLV